MEEQMSFAAAEYGSKRKQTRRERFLAEMEELVPWKRLVGLIEPVYPSGKRGRPPIGVERMLRIYFLQNWYGLADEALEDAIIDSMAMRQFCRIDLGREEVPDATTLLKFRHLLEEHGLTKAIFAEVVKLLGERGVIMREGTLVDATIIHAPSSTKNAGRSRDPEMKQTRKGNQWYFGMKAHIGADDVSGLVHTVVGTSANVSDVSMVPELLHGQEMRAGGDAGYQGAATRVEAAGGPMVEWNIARKRGRLRAMTQGKLKDVLLALERAKASVRAKVERPFHIIKNLFGHRKVRYRGLSKNTAQLHTLFALANLVIARDHLREVQT